MYRMVHQAPWISATLLQHVIVKDAPKLNKALALRRCRNSDCYPLVCDLELLLVRLGGSRQPTHRPPHLRRNKFSFFNHEEEKIKLAFRLELKIHFLMFKNRAKTVLARKRSQIGRIFCGPCVWLLLVPWCFRFPCRLPKMNAIARRSLATSTLCWYNSPKLKSLPSLSLVSVQRTTQQPSFFGTTRMNLSPEDRISPSFYLCFFWEKESKPFVCTQHVERSRQISLW